MAYLKNKHLANIKKWNLDLSKYNDGVYDETISVPKDLKEFTGFKELFGLDIKEIKGVLSFLNCKSLTSVSNLPKYVGVFLSFWGCESLTSVSNLPEYVGGYLSFYGCISLTSISNLPEKIVSTLSFDRCTSLTSVSNLPEKIGGNLFFENCTSLTSLPNMPSVVQGHIYTTKCPFFEGMTEQQIREKYNTSQILYTYLDFKLDRSGSITHNSKST